MAGVLFVLGVALLVAQQSECKYSGFHSLAIKENGNAYIDDVVTKVREAIYDKGLDPYEAIDKTWLGVHIVGELNGLRSIHRVDDANITYSDDVVDVDAKFRVFGLSARLSWKTNFSFLPTIDGGATSTISEVIVTNHVRRPHNSTHAQITAFKITEVGHIHTDIDTKSHIPGLDRLVIHISDTIANYLKNVVVYLLEGPIREVVQTTLDDVDIPSPEED